MKQIAFISLLLLLVANALNAQQLSSTLVRTGAPIEGVLASAFEERPKSETRTDAVLTTPEPVRVNPKNPTLSWKAEYSIQLGAFAIRSNAERLRNRLRKDGLQVEVFENYLDGKQLLNLVWVGSYGTLEEAQMARTALHTTYNVKGIILPRRSWQQ